MKRMMVLVVTLVIISGADLSFADEKPNPEVVKKLTNLVQLGPGVHAIKRDKQGRIESCIVIGNARISTVLGKAKGLETAREKARLAASAEFVKWLKEKVSVHQKSEEETILFLEGSADNDKQALKESGKSIEKTGKRIESVAEGLIRGLQVLHVEVSEKDMTYTLLLGWSRENVKAAEQVEKGEEPKPKDDPKKLTDPKAKDAPKVSPDKKIEDKKATSDDIKKFLP
jgi:hypothetical protein